MSSKGGSCFFAATDTPTKEDTLAHAVHVDSRLPLARSQLPRFETAATRLETRIHNRKNENVDIDGCVALLQQSLIEGQDARY
jgi:hypothetical protein